LTSGIPKCATEFQMTFLNMNQFINFPFFFLHNIFSVLSTSATFLLLPEMDMYIYWCTVFWAGNDLEVLLRNIIGFT
jgi:hypothetical protein